MSYFQIYKPGAWCKFNHSGN